MARDFDSIPEKALAWIAHGKQVALATVVETWGSAPRPAGAQMAITADGEMVGSVSGGCVEGAVVLEAREAIAAGRRVLLDYGVSDNDAFAVGLACGGRISVMVEPVGTVLPIDILHQLADARSDRKAVALVSNMAGNQAASLSDENDAVLGAEIGKLMQEDRSGPHGDRFIGIHNPPLRLAVVGAVHIAQPLVRMARMAGYDVTVIDPRDSFATGERFPDDTVVTAWPDEALREHGLDARTAVVTLTHDPKLDDPAILAAAGSDIFYLGCLGSTRTHAKRLERLSKAGLTADELDRISGPVGLDIGARTPAEIAISILAELTQSLRQGK